MKKLLIIATLLIATAAIAGTNLQPAGNNPSGVQGFAPDGTLSQALTINSAIIDLSTSIAFGVYSPADCIARVLPTSAKGSYPSFTVPGGSWLIRVRNQATPFLNLSGCTNGHLQRQ